MSPPKWFLLVSLLLCVSPVLADVTFDVSSSSSSASTASLSWSHAGGTLTNGVVVVGVNLASSARTVTSVTFNGVGLTQAHRQSNAITATEIWRLVAPANGTNTVVVNLDSAGELVSGACTFNGADQTTPLTGITGANAASLVITSTSGDIAIAALTNQDIAFITSGTERWSVVVTTIDGSGGTIAGASPNVTLSWTATANPTIAGANVQKVQSGGVARRRVIN